MADPTENVLTKPKAKTARGKRVLQRRDPQLLEGAKQAVFVRGTTTSQLGTACLQALYALKKQHSVMLSKRNDLHPFDYGKNEPAVEFLMQRNDASLMCLHTHSKKRPHTLTFVRSFDHHLYDMYELHVDTFRALGDICLRGSDAWTPGEKPVVLFSGEAFQMDDTLQSLRLMLLDFFRGAPVSSLDPSELHTVLHFSASPDGRHLALRVHRLSLNPEGAVQMTPLGPFADFSVGRSKLPSEEARRLAHRVPRQLQPKRQKNVTTNVLGQRLGRVHVGRQDIARLQTRKVKAFRK
jgi:ribosome production factor 2